MDQEKLDYDVKKMYLKRYSRMMKRIERLEDKLANMDDRLYSVGSGEISDMPRGGVPKTLDDLIAAKDETLNRIDQLVRTSRSIRSEIYQVIDTLEDYREVEVLEQFFIEGLTIEEIAERSGYAIRHVRRFYSNALHTIDVTLCQ